MKARTATAARGLDVPEVFMERLRKLSVDLGAFRSAYRKVFSGKMATPRSCGAYFWGVLSSSSSLYCDYLALETLGAKLPPLGRSDTPTSRPRGVGRRANDEPETRNRFRTRVEELKCWSVFSPRNAFAEENGLRGPADYRLRLIIHLPEIYCEAAKLRALIQQRLRGAGARGAGHEEVLVTLEHIAHHASYSRHALEILADEDSWRPRSLAN